jgi:hypothetical protein
MDALARTWRGPALCKNHGQRDGEKGLELEQDITFVCIFDPGTIAVHYLPARAAWYLGKRR